MTSLEGVPILPAEATDLADSVSSGNPIDLY